MLSKSRLSRLQFLATAIAALSLATLPILSAVSAHLHRRDSTGATPLPPYVLVEAALARTHITGWPASEIALQKISSRHVEKVRNGSD